MLAGGAAAAQPALATGVRFQRGDLLASVGGGINDYAPDGTLRSTFAGGSGAGALCFDPSGRYLVAPGVGLFDGSGNLLPSNWASLRSSYGECAVDGYGHVYVGQGPYGVDSAGNRWGTIEEYNLTGNLLRSFTVPTDLGGTVPNIDLAPDQCTIYYDADGGSGIYRFNVCTNTPEPPYEPGCCAQRDQLRVFPNWDVVDVNDEGVGVSDPSGNGLEGWSWMDTFGITSAGRMRWVSLDPNDTSFWVASTGGSSCGSPPDPPTPPTSTIWQIDVNTKQVVHAWTQNSCTGITPTNLSLGGIAAYGPPLLGDANVKSTVDSDSAGTAEAFRTNARFSGQLLGLHVYLDASSTASQVVVGIYSDHNGHPGTLQEQATITKLMAGSWNYVDVPSMPISAGQPYWVAVLGPKGGGTIRFRDTAGGGRSETSSQHQLTALPAQWSTGAIWASAPLSGYGS